MKNIFLISLALLLLFSVGCTQEDATIIRVATLAGPTGMGMTKIIDEAEGKYDITILTSPDQITPKIINNEVDICAIPSNLASILYNKANQSIVILSINTTGVLYIVENGDTIKNIEDLRYPTALTG